VDAVAIITPTANVLFYKDGMGGMLALDGTTATHGFVRLVAHLSADQCAELSAKLRDAAIRSVCPTCGAHGYLMTTPRPSQPTYNRGPHGTGSAEDELEFWNAAVEWLKFSKGAEAAMDYCSGAASQANKADVRLYRAGVILFGPKAARPSQANVT
jgi:hypothetical protein